MALLCASCGATARDDARFCASGGAALVRGCPGCGAPVDPGARFCSSCGVAVAEPPNPAPAPSEERRIISVLFADLVGFTSHTERTDPEDSRRRLTVYHTRVRQDVERFGGRLEKLMGDGVFAVFGAPVAHEDDPERAVRAAIRVLESVQELNAYQPNLALAVRVAVTTGEAIVQLEQTRDREGIVGDVVNTASRLQGVASPGEVVVDERTFRATRHAVNFEGLDEVALKGKENKQAVWRATGLRSRYGVAVEEEATTPYVGRSDELGLLADSFERAVARRRPQLVTVVGEPGVGKSRLVREFRRVIDDRPDLVWWRQGRCLPYGEGVTFWAIGEVVKAQAGILDSEPTETVTAKLRSTVAALFDDPDEAAWVELRLASLVGLGGSGAERTELFAAWLRFFEALAARSPLIMVVEDIQWADDAVVEFLSHILDWAKDSPILLICTARPELFSSRPDWGGGKRDAVTIGLSPLSEDETVRLMSSLSKRPLMDASLQRALVERSGGNPLYICEFVCLAEEQGWFERLRRGGDIPLPDSIASIIAARLDLLSPEDKSLLQAAAVIGRVFWAGALSFVEGLDPTEVQNRLRRLISRELIRPIRRSSMQGQDEYTFAHVLARDGAYKRLTREDRARLHEATARWLEAVSGDRTADVAELLAHHHATAWELAPSPDDERRRRVYRFQMAAGDRARPFDAGAAVRFYRSAVALASTGPEKGRPLLEIAKLSISTVEEQVEMLTEALDEFASGSDRQGQAEAASQLAIQEWFQGHADESDRWSDISLELAADLEPSPMVAKVLAAAASARSLRGQEEEALELVERTMAVARAVGDTSSYARALVIKGTATSQMGEVDGMGDILEGLRIQLDLNDTTHAMSTYNNAATIQIGLGFFEQGRKLIEEAITYGRNRGLQAHVDWSRGTRNEALFPMGEWDDCLREADDLVEEDAHRGGSQVGTFAKVTGALVRFFRGDTTDSLAKLEEGLNAAREIEDPQALIPILSFLIMCAGQAGDRARVTELADELAPIAHQHPVFMAGCIDLVAQALRKAGLSEQLTDLVKASKVNGPRPLAQVNFARAAESESSGDLEGAFGTLQSVIEDSDRMSHRFLGTIARVEAARVAGLLEMRDDQTRLLDEAQSLAEGMRAQRFLDQITAMRGEGRKATASGSRP